MLLEGREQGFGIPDDVMMRLNVSTALDLRELLGEVLPAAVTEPGEEATALVVPLHIRQVVDRHSPDPRDRLHRAIVACKPGWG